ncbi:hypothetical protein [Streptomyces scabiei]|uniref:hypothetical protein n=1 Tax=Streptomyces scabiei TaxID=1930 RepID=UPI000AD08B40|nr:hypothetical protein [Streptomyces scabiei]
MNAQITEPMSMAVAALDAMDNHAALVRKVAERLLSEDSDGLPPLAAVRVEASTNRARIVLQSQTETDLLLWAQALDVTPAEQEPNRDLYEGGYYVHLVAEFVVDGVDVRLASARWVSTCAAVSA